MAYSKGLIVAAATCAAGYVATAHATDAAVQAHCLEKWSGDAMRTYCLEEQQKSFEAVARYSGPIRSDCEADWRGDFHMVLFCIRERQPQAQAAALDSGELDGAN